MSRRLVPFAIAAGIVLLAIFVAGDYLASYANTIDAIHWEGAPLPPCFENVTMCGGHLLGTDGVGRDLLARLLVGGRVTLGVSLWAVLFEFGIAMVFGLLARAGRPMKYLIARVADAISCLSPWPFMAIVMIAVLSSRGLPLNRGVHFAVIALWAAILSCPSLIRLTVGSWESRALLSQAARDWAKIILVLATIDFFGYGTWPPTPSWGNMLVHLQLDLQTAWWSAVFPALCLFVAVLGIEMFARAFSPAELPIFSRREGPEKETSQ